MVARVLENLNHEVFNSLVILKDEHIKEFLAEVEQLTKAGITIAPIENTTEGTVCTVLSVHSIINSDKPLIIANSDQLVEFDINCLSQTTWIGTWMAQY